MSEQFRVTSCCDVEHSGRENLHQILPILLWTHALSSSIMTLWIGDAAIPGKRKIHTSFTSFPPPQTKAITQWERRLEWRHAVTLNTQVGENLHHFLPVLLRGMLPLFSIMTLWYHLSAAKSMLGGGCCCIAEVWTQRNLNEMRVNCLVRGAQGRRPVHQRRWIGLGGGGGGKMSESSCSGDN